MQTLKKATYNVLLAVAYAPIHILFYTSPPTWISNYNCHIELNMEQILVKIEKASQKYSLLRGLLLIFDFRP